MDLKFNLKNYSFLIFGLGLTGISVVNYLKKKGVSNYFVWDDNLIAKNKFKSKKTNNLKKTLQFVDYVVLSPGISLHNNKHKNILSKFKKKIITDLDLLYLNNKNFKSIVVTGTNGKSTTCKIIHHLLKKNKYNCALGGNIGTPVLNTKIKTNNYLIIEASSFQLAHSKFVKPNYALLLNITNDHLDWHGNMQNYISSKLRIFSLQKKNCYALINSDLKKILKIKDYQTTFASLEKKKYKKIHFKLENDYLRSKSNEQNMYFVYTLAKLLKINDKSFLRSMKSFKGLPHRHEIFFKRKNITAINDSKATSFKASKFALSSSKNIYWILGGLAKYGDKIDLLGINNNIIKAYIIGKNTEYFKRQLKNKIKFVDTKNLKKAIITVFQDIKFSKYNCTILFSPAAASFDQFKNFEIRGIEFKKLIRMYAKKYI